MRIQDWNFLKMVTHEVSPGVTISCPGSDLCRRCQRDKRITRLERKLAKRRTSRKERRLAKQAIRNLKEPIKLKKEYLPEWDNDRYTKAN